MGRSGHSRARTGRTLDRQGTGGIARAWYLCQILALLLATLRQSQYKLGLLCLTHNCVEIQDTVWPWNLQVIQNPSKDEDGLQRTSWTWSEHLRIVIWEVFWGLEKLWTSFTPKPEMPFWGTGRSHSAFLYLRRPSRCSFWSSLGGLLRPSRVGLQSHWFKARDCKTNGNVKTPVVIRNFYTLILHTFEEKPVCINNFFSVGRSCFHATKMCHGKLIIIN